MFLCSMLYTFWPHARRDRFSHTDTDTVYKRADDDRYWGVFVEMFSRLLEAAASGLRRVPDVKHHVVAFEISIHK